MFKLWEQDRYNTSYNGQVQDKYSRDPALVAVTIYEILFMIKDWIGIKPQYWMDDIYDFYKGLWCVDIAYLL